MPRKPAERLCRSHLSFLAAAACVAGLAGPAFSMDLLQIYREALSYDAQYAAARATVEAGREKMPQARAGLLPNIGATANVARNAYTYHPDPGREVSRDFNSSGYSVTLSQPLFRWQNIVQYDQSKWQVAQAEAVFAQASQDLILRVAQAYFDVLYAQENLRAVRANKQAIAQQLEQAKKYFEVGTATVTDSQEAQSRFDLASAQEIAAESDLEVKRHALRVIIGKDGGELNRLKAQANLLPPQPPAMNAWVEAAEKDGIAVQVQQAAAEIAAREIERMRAGHYPTLDAVASIGRNNTASGIGGNATLSTDARSVGLQLTIPIYQGGLVNSRTREAAANRMAADAALDNARRLAAQNARQSYLGVVNGLAQVRALEAALASSRLALESNKLGYEVGVRINIDVLNAEQQVYSTTSNLAKARFDTLMAQLKLKAAVGALNEADLEEINPLFEPAP